jgi:hypothetical protein
MASLVISVAVGVLTFGLGLLGLYLKRLVPERHMSAGSRDMIGAVIGLLSLLLALVLGTLVGSAYEFFLRPKKATSSRSVRARLNWIWRFDNTDQRRSRCAKR